MINSMLRNRPSGKRGVFQINCFNPVEPADSSDLDAKPFPASLPQLHWYPQRTREVASELANLRGKCPYKRAMLILLKIAPDILGVSHLFIFR
jgi:hypothetical protein